MIRWAAGLLRRALGALLLLLLLIFGSEIGLRVNELRSAGKTSLRRDQSPQEAITIPSWSTYQELRPLTKIPVKDREGSRSHDLIVNSYGMRGPEVAVPKRPGIYRVLCLGDELVLATAVDEERHFCARLEERLQHETKLQVEVWNCGVPGACPLTEYLLLTHRLSSLQPDLVVVVVQESDLADDLKCRRTTRNDREGIPLACRHPSLGRPLRTDPLTAWRSEFRLIDVGLRSAGNVWKRKTDYEHATGETRAMTDFSRLRQDRTAIERTLAPLAPLAAWSRNSYASLCVCEVRGDAGETSASPFSSALKELAAAQRFAFFDFSPTVREERSARRRNWSAEVHREFADAMGPRIVNEISGPGNSPQFRSLEPGVTPVSFERNRGDKRMLNHDPRADRR